MAADGRTAGGYEVLMAARRNVDAHAMAAASLARSRAPWESSLQATCECLSWRGALDNLVRRNAEDDLGETVYADVPSEARPAVVTAHLLMDKGLFSEEELRSKMAEVRERFEKE